MTERETLFRPELLLLRPDRNFGTPLLQHNGLSGLFVLLSTILVAATLLLLAFTHYKESATTRGVLEPVGGSHRVVAPVSAIVAHIAVRVGDTVDKGQVLAELERATFDAQGTNVGAIERDQLHTQYASAQEQHGLQSHRFRAARKQLLSVKDELTATLALIDSEQALLHQSLQLSESNFAALEKLRARRAVTRAQLEQAQLANLEFQLRLQAVLQRRQAHVAQIQAQESQIENLDMDFAQMRLRSEQELQRLRFAITQTENQSRLTVVAAAAGVIATMAIEPGQSVQALQPLFYVQTEPLALQATLYVPSRVLGKLYPGQEVLLSYDAFDIQHYGRYVAMIERIEHASLDPREHLLPVPGIHEPVFRITAQLGQSWVEGDEVYRLQAGMLFNADIVMQESSLLEFIFRPVLQLRARIT